jgi:Na+-translocating ferredoxin:NAD+ oxidoreductase subunit A
MDFGKIIIISISAIFINNYVFSRFLGICPFVGVSKKLDSATGMGFAVIFVMTLAAAVCSALYRYLLVPMGLTFLQTLLFILVIGALVQFVEMVIAKISPSLYKALGIYLPLITTNCAVLGVTVLNVSEQYNFIESVVNGFMSGVGFTIALLLMSGIRERYETMDIPKPLEGFPITFMTAAGMGLAFMGFSGLSF